MNLRDNESLLNLCNPLIYLIYNRSRAGEFDALHQCFLVRNIDAFLPCVINYRKGDTLNLENSVFLCPLSYKPLRGSYSVRMFFLFIT